SSAQPDSESAGSGDWGGAGAGPVPPEPWAGSGGDAAWGRGDPPTPTGGPGAGPAAAVRPVGGEAVPAARPGPARLLPRRRRRPGAALGSAAPRGRPARPPRSLRLLASPVPAARPAGARRHRQTPRAQRRRCTAGTESGGSGDRVRRERGQSPEGAGTQLLETTLAVSAAPPGAWDPPGPGRKPPALGDKRKRQRLLPPCEDLGPLPGRKALRALGTLGVQRDREALVVWSVGRRRGVPSASSPRHPGSLTPRSCPPRAAAAMPVTVTVTLPGPAPWGFRISGGRDFGKPITVSKVTEHGKAAAGDLRPGDVIVTINGESTAEMLNVEAQNKIKQSPGQLRLEVQRSPVPSPSHTNGDTSLEGLATRFQDTLQMPSESQSALRTLDPSLASLSASSQPLEQEFTCPSLRQERRLSRQSIQGPVLPPPPRPPHRSSEPPNPLGSPQERRLSSASTCLSQGSEPAMRRLEDSEVYKMLQENRELRAAPRQSSTFLLQEALEDEEGGGPAFPSPSRPGPAGPWPGAEAAVCEKSGAASRPQAVRIQDGRYRHPSPSLEVPKARLDGDYSNVG
ncbi:LOW QUALITY PROTEIN: PDZ and LIM domain protein 2, partial [Geothlypis trichas]